ncbi:MAG: class I SAM-dependent methyltransferase [Planctomycetes bacterium]|nr:class I SAM-dependent methyltransferase [Planctomycetota bacterium]
MTETNPSTDPGSRTQHWNRVYETKSDEQLSWLQASPDTSLALFDAITPPPRSAIDIGGGQSLFAAKLLSRGVEHVAVLDISAAAIERAKARLGEPAPRVHWIVADVTAPWHSTPVDLWHDRAVFHFLTNPADRAAYAARAACTVKPGGSMIIATFAPDGPPKCSGLDVRRYDPPSLAREFSPAFELVTSTTESHRTPWGSTQSFIYVVLRRIGQTPNP